MLRFEKRSVMYGPKDDPITRADTIGEDCKFLRQQIEAASSDLIMGYIGLDEYTRQLSALDQRITELEEKVQELKENGELYEPI